MAVLSGTTNVQENGPAASDDVTSGTTTIAYLTYVDRSGTTQTDVPIPAGGINNLPTHYGFLTIHQDGTYTYTPDNSIPAVNALDVGGTLSDPFSYQFDTGVVGDEGTTTVVIQGNNDAPTATPDTYNGNEGTPVTGNVITDNTGAGPDTDPEGNPLTAAVVTGPTHGSLTFNTDGSFTYTTTDPNYNGADSFTYQTTDSHGAVSNTATVTLNIAPDAASADSPVAVDDNLGSQPEDVSTTYPVSALTGNDYNPDGETLTVDQIGPIVYAADGVTQVGSVTYNATAQTFTVTTNADYNGPAQFTYIEHGSDAPGSFTTATAHLTIDPVNDAPVTGGNGTAVGTEDAPITGTVPAATDVDSTPLHYTITSQNLNGGDGTLTLNQTTGQYTYTPGPSADQALDTGDSRTITFTYVATDAGQDGVFGTADDLSSAPATITITENGVNDAPVANPDTYTGTEDTPLVVNSANGVLANDTDKDDTVLTVTGNSTPLNGTVVMNPDGSFTYTPDANFSGTDTFNYTVSDGETTSTGTVSVNVGNTADDPVAGNDTAGVTPGIGYTTEDVPGQAAGLAVGGAAFRTSQNGFFSETQLLANDTDPDGGPLHVTSVGNAVGGTVQLVTRGGQTYAVFTPFANYSGPASFDYAVTDPQGNSDVGHVSLVVQEQSDGAPVANPDTVAVTELQYTTVTAAQLLANDTDPDNAGAGAGTDQLGIRQITAGAGVEFRNVVTDPTTGNIVQFEVRSTSHEAGVSPTFTYLVDDQAARAGVAGDTAAPGAIGGTRTVGVDDARSGTGLGTVTLNVTNVQDAPVATDNTFGPIQEDTPANPTVTFTVTQLLANDSDPDNVGGSNAGLTVVNVAGLSPNAVGDVAVEGGTLHSNGNGTFVYTQSVQNYNGSADFNYTITDPQGNQSTAQVHITVTPTNDNPVANPDTLTFDTTLGSPLIAENSESVFSFSQFLANDTDVDGDTLTITNATSPQGTAAIVGNTVHFTPTNGYVGAATITYTVSDGHGGTTTGTASFTVVPTVVGGSGADTTLTSPTGGSAVFNGNDGNDVLNGTPQTDELNGGNGNDVLNGLGADDYLRGGAGNDTANGGDGNDSIYMDDGGNDVSHGDAGDDGIYYGASFGVNDLADGGTGNDTLALRGNTGAAGAGNALILSNTASGTTAGMQSIETLLLASGSNTTMFPNTPAGGPFSYYFVEQDSAVAAGQTLTIIAGSPAPGVNGLQAGENLQFDGSDEKDGSFAIFAGMGTDRLIGGQQDDGFFFETGAFTNADVVDGRAGNDGIALRGDYSGGVTLTNVTNVENIALLSGYTNEYGGALYGGSGPAAGSFDYNVTLAAGNVHAGQTLFVTGAGLQTGEDMTIDGRSVTGGNLTILGGAGDDTIHGGRQTNVINGTGGTDFIYGGRGGDYMDGGSSAPAGGLGANGDGANVYGYRAADESHISQTDINAGATGQLNLDHIAGFDFTQDKLDINAGGAATNGQTAGFLNVTDVNAVFGGTFTDTAEVGSVGSLSDNEFLTQLGNQLNGALDPGQAAFLQVTSDFSGQYAGSTIFVADANGNGTVDTGDLIIVFDNLQGQLPPSTDFIM